MLLKNQALKERHSTVRALHEYIGMGGRVAGTTGLQAQASKRQSNPKLPVGGGLCRGKRAERRVGERQAVSAPPPPSETQQHSNRRQFGGAGWAGGSQAKGG